MLFFGSLSMLAQTKQQLEKKKNQLQKDIQNINSLILKSRKEQKDVVVNWRGFL